MSPDGQMSGVCVVLKTSNVATVILYAALQPILGNITVVMMLSRRKMIKVGSASQATPVLLYFMSLSVTAFQVLSRLTLADE